MCSGNPVAGERRKAPGDEPASSALRVIVVDDDEVDRMAVRRHIPVDTLAVERLMPSTGKLQV